MVILDVQADSQDLNLVDLQPSARLNVPMNTNDLSKSVYFLFFVSFTNLLLTVQCMWYNETAWATAGCATQTSPPNVVCLCDQVAVMAVMEVVSYYI